MRLCLAGPALALLIRSPLPFVCLPPCPSLQTKKAKSEAEYYATSKQYLQEI